MNIQVESFGEGRHPHDQWFLQSWRRARGNLPLREVGEATGLSIANLSQWERGSRVPDIDDLIRLDDFYNAAGALISLAQAGRVSCAVIPAREQWWSNLSGSGPVWVWLRGPAGSAGTHAMLQWGVLSGSVEVSGVGLIVWSAVSIKNPAVKVTFTAPGLAHFGTGRIPREFGIPLVTGLDVARFVNRHDSSFRLFRGQLGVLLASQFKWVKQILGFLQHRQDLVRVVATEPNNRTPALDLRMYAEPPRQGKPVVALDPDEYRELRTARCLSRASAARVVTEQFPSDPVLPRDIKSLELGHEPRVEHLRARLDRLYETDGFTVFERCPANASPGLAEIRFPAYWRGPIWLRFQARDASARKLTLRWGPWQKRILVPSNIPITCRYAGGKEPLWVSFDPSWELACGVGVYLGAANVNEDWEPVDLLAGVALFHQYSVVYLRLFERSKEEFGKLMRFVRESLQSE